MSAELRPLAPSIEAWRRLRTELAANFDLTEDDDFLPDTLDGMTDLGDQMHALMQRAAEQEAFADALEGMIQQSRARKERLKKAAATIRSHVAEAASEAGIKKLPRPDMTLSFGMTKPSQRAFNRHCLATTNDAVGAFRAALEAIARTLPPETVGGGATRADLVQAARMFMDWPTDWAKRLKVCSSLSEREVLAEELADFIQRHRDQAALSSAPPAEETWQAPDGFRLVPIVATDEMRDAAVKGSRADVSYYDVDELWPAMLAAAPLPTAPAGEAKAAARTYPGGCTKEEWDVKARSSYACAAHLPED